MTGLVLCRCGLAKHQVHVDAPTGRTTVLVCEHCDNVCVERACRLCAAASRAAAG